MLALDKYLGEFDKPQIVFVARQKQPKCSDEAVTATLELESYIVQGKKELTSTRVAMSTRSLRMKLKLERQVQS